MNGARMGVLTAVIFAATSASAQSDMTESGSGWRYASIDMRIALFPDEGRMLVQGTARFELTTESSAGPMLLLRQSAYDATEPNIQFVSLTPSIGEVTTINEPFAPVPGTIWSRIRSEEPFTQGDTIEVEFAIEGVGVRNQFAITPEYATASWTSGWYPAPAPRPDEGFGSGLISATGRVVFEMPATWRAVSCGDMTDRTVANGRATEVWTLDEPRAIGFACGPFQSSVVEAGERSVGMFRLSADEESVPAQADALNRVIDAMAEKFGPYPYNRFSIAETPDVVPGFWAASEQGFILAKPTVFSAAGGNLPLFAHEAAHAWWGNLVGESGVGGIFLTESLSQYGAVLAIEAIEGEDAATDFLRFSRPEYIVSQCARGYFQVIRDGEDRPISSIEQGGGVNHTIADAKGHWVHHMLRRRVGDEVYFGTLQALTDRYAGGSMSLPTFREAFMNAAPDARLEQFFAQWLDRTGAPVVDLDWRRQDNDTIEVRITQRQTGEPYDLDLEIEMEGVGETRVETIRVTEGETTLTLDSPFRATVVRLDPRHKVLRWTPEYGSRPE